jgi:hypothetical protein
MFFLWEKCFRQNKNNCEKFSFFSVYLFCRISTISKFFKKTCVFACISNKFRGIQLKFENSFKMFKVAFGLFSIRCFFINSALAENRNESENQKNVQFEENFSENPPPPVGTDKSLRKISSVPLPSASGKKVTEKESQMLGHAEGWSFEKQPSAVQKFPSPDSLSVLAPTRKVTLNGVNIGTMRNEELSNVKVLIDDQGNIKILAPQYEASHQSSFHPLLSSDVPKYKKESFLKEDVPEKIGEEKSKSSEK